MTALKNFFSSISALTLIDLIFFVAVIVLIILIVTLIYFIKINEDEMEPILDILPDSIPDENGAEELIDLQSITKALEEREKNPIDMTEYEQEQEERAIISYDELLEKSKNLSLNYETELKDEDIIIKKVDLENLVNNEEDEKPLMEVRVISYQKEEAFLEALKQLKEQIN